MTTKDTMSVTYSLHMYYRTACMYNCFNFWNKIGTLVNFANMVCVGIHKFVASKYKLFDTKQDSAWILEIPHLSGGQVAAIHFIARLVVAVVQSYFYH